MRMTRMGKRVTFVTAMAVAPLMFAASSAWAVTITLGSNYAYNSGTTVRVCDQEEDGNGVYVEYWGNGGIHGTVWDGNGSQSGCGSSGSLSSLTHMKLCEDDWGSDTCSARWRV